MYPFSTSPLSFLLLLLYTPLSLCSTLSSSPFFIFFLPLPLPLLPHLFFLSLYCSSSISSLLLISGSGDIVNNNLKLILGLIWTLILHYQISIGFGIEDDGKGGHSGLTPKQALLAYLQVQYIYIYICSTLSYILVYMYTHHIYTRACTIYAPYNLLCFILVNL